jgi:hypothetical protein
MLSFFCFCCSVLHFACHTTPPRSTPPPQEITTLVLLTSQVAVAGGDLLLAAGVKKSGRGERGARVRVVVRG